MMSLQQKTLIGVRWNLISTIITTAFGILILWSLSHLLDVNQYGVISAALIVSNFSNMLLDFGISNSIVRSKSVQDDELSSLYVLNVLIGLAIFFVVFLLSPFLASLFHAGKELISQIRIISFGFIISSFGLQPRALMTRAMRFDLLSKITIITTLTNFLVAVSLAYIYHSVWCVAVAFIISNFINVLTTNYFSKVNGIKSYSLIFEYRYVKRHLSYGVQLVCDSLINQISVNTYPVLMSRLVSIAAIGGYNISYSISIALFERLNPVLAHALFPAFSKISSDEKKISKNFLKVTCFSSFVNFPILLGMYISCDYVVHVFFQAKWAFIVPIVSTLCIVGAVRSLDTPVISILLVKGQMYRNVYLGIFKLSVGIPLSWYLGHEFGILGIVYSFLVTQALNTFLSYFYLISPVINVSFLQYFKAILVPLLSVLPMIFIGLKLKEYFLNNLFVVYPITCLVSLITISIIVFLITLFILPFKEVKDFRVTIIGFVLSKKV